MIALERVDEPVFTEPLGSVTDAVDACINVWREEFPKDPSRYSLGEYKEATHMVADLALMLLPEDIRSPESALAIARITSFLAGDEHLSRRLETQINTALLFIETGVPETEFYGSSSTWEFAELLIRASEVKNPEEPVV